MRTETRGFSLFSKSVMEKRRGIGRGARKGYDAIKMNGNYMELNTDGPFIKQFLV